VRFLSPVIAEIIELYEKPEKSVALAMSPVMIAV
jgi:hypothetical protein